MRSFQSHKVVQAMRIGKWEPAANGTHDVILWPHEDEEGVAKVVVTADWVAKHSDGQGADALSGGYYVSYPDGYQSWSPAEAFESGYELEVEPPPPPVHEPQMPLRKAQDEVSVMEHPRVSKDSIDARIGDVRYIYDGTGTFCVIAMVNGFEVNGFSKPASPDNYDRQVGERYAYENAFRQLWQLEGYLLCERLTMSDQWRDRLNQQLDNAELANP